MRIFGQRFLLGSPAIGVLSLDDAALVDPDTDGNAAFAAGCDDSIHLLAILNVAGIQANLVDARFNRLQCPLEVKMYVGHDGDRRLGENGGQGVGIRLGRDCDAHHIAPRLGELTDLGHRRIDVVGVGAGHRLNRHRCAPADGDATHVNSSRFSALDHRVMDRHSRQ